MSSHHSHNLPVSLDRDWHSVIVHAFFGSSLIAFVLQNLGDPTLDGTRRLILVALLALAVGNFSAAMTTHRSRPIYIQLALAVEWINNVFAAFLLIMAMIGTFPPSMSYTNNNIRRGTSGHGHSHGHGHGDTGSVEESYLGFAHWILDHKLLSKKFSGFGFASSGSGVAFGVYSAVFVLALAVVRYRKKMSSVSKIRAWIDGRVHGRISLNQDIALAEANAFLGLTLLFWLPLNLQQHQIIRIIMAIIGLLSVAIPLKANNEYEFVVFAFPIYFGVGLISGWFSIASILYPEILAAPGFLFWLLIGVSQLFYHRMYVSKLPLPVSRKND